GLLALVQSLPLPSKLAQLVRMIPRRDSALRVNESARLRFGAVIAAQGPRRARVGIFVGCIMGSLFGHVHAATIRVLTRNGCEVVIVPGQWCCGALNLHAGERTIAARMARANVKAFAGEQLDAIVVNSAGCGAVMKAYAELLDDDAAATSFAMKVRDAAELLAQLGLRPGLRPLRAKVTYQDACHLAHGQRVREAPRTLLQQIPGLTYVEMPHADRCCGAAGVYSLTQPELSAEILAEKVGEIGQTGAALVATTNPGCAMQLQAGLAGRDEAIRVCHLMELLDRSYSGGP
ncbi:MAG TPA: (Fe-S)-binding protein, partial [Candidatus Eremiobacteraceae bacterium]|nr:(Fe-S)-binding protein [Candidatus Eremiobacteraceae bacterium]